MRYVILTWNVNGIRAAEKKGFPGWLARTRPDLLALQETKADESQLSADLRRPQGYYTYWSGSERKGYSGAGLYSRQKPQRVAYGLGNELFDKEGRVLIAEYPRFILFNIYFPNGKMNARRLEFKLDFYREFLGVIRGYKQKKKTLIVGGDFNTAHREIDLARPAENSRISGFLPQERMLIDELIALGFVDTFRHFHKEPEQYTWWDIKSKARERNVGWRIDYFFIDKQSLPRLENAFILTETAGSDHCPAGIILHYPG